jgi:phosphoribosylamine--glycine ligase
MKILVIGSGGREHALIWKLKQSPLVTEIFCAPGNAGIAQMATCVSLKVSESSAVLKFVKEKNIDLTVIGPELPLVNGLVDFLEENGRKVFGPSKAAAQLEGSKVFSKNFMQRNKIPTARFRSFKREEFEAARTYLDEIGIPCVVKADGLAAGKGVLICTSYREAVNALEEVMVKNSFGSAGELTVVEEFLKGEEASIFALTDGENVALLASAQDHKRILDGDMGKNTGGMGAYAPAPVVTGDLMFRIKRDIVVPTLEGMKKEGNPYRGCLYVGLMMTEQGPKVLEYNCRFGDPETQVVVPLIDGDLAEIFLSIAERRLQPSRVRIHPASAVCVVMASQGYPDEYQTGKKIVGLDTLKPDDGVVVFHAGTKNEGDAVVSAGGRVLGVTAIGYPHELERTIRNAYRAVEQITFDGAYYRSDIGKKALNRQPSH